MKKFRKLLIGAACAVAGLTSAQAAFVNVGGVFIDPDSPLDFSGTSATITQSISAQGVLSGFGVVTVLNGTPVSTFCPGCELTIQYGGYTPIGQVIVPTPTPGLAISYSGGFVNLFVDFTPDADPTNPLQLTSANTGDGDLWAQFVGHATAGNTTLVGVVSGTATNPRLLGNGVLDLLGGAAFPILDTNGQEDGSDLAFSTSFTTFPNGNLFFGTGTGNFDGDASLVPEPSSIALLGLGLAGLGFAQRRRHGAAK